MRTECTSEQFEFEGFGRRRVVAAFDAGAMSSDGGGLLLRHTDRAIGLIERVAACFVDEREQDQVIHTLPALVGQRVVGIALGYEDVNDHDELRYDPVLALFADQLEPKRSDCAPLAGKSTLNRLEHAPLRRDDRYHKIGHDPTALANLFVDLFLEAHKRPPKQIVLDLDATDDPLHGQQEGRFFHGYYSCYCYLPLYVFCGRHLLAALLRPSDIDASAGAVEEVARIVERIRAAWPRVRILLRADSGFARDELMAWCEANRLDDVFGLARNPRLVAELEADLAVVAAEHAQTGQPARRFKEFFYATLDSWSRARRVVGKAEHLAKEQTRALSSPRSAPPRSTAGSCTRASTAPGARWRTGSKSNSSTCSPTAPRPRACGRISCACGSRPSPTCCSRPYGASACAIRSSRTPPAARSD
jgi:hypothetical protein